MNMEHQHKNRLFISHLASCFNHLVIFIILSSTFHLSNGHQQYCRDGLVTFELITGYVYTSSGDTMTMLPGTLQLTECLQSCKQNDSCQSVNFETGLCVLLIHSAREKPEALTSSQFPVFTIYAQKMCLSGKQRRRCDGEWAFERTVGYVLTNFERKKLTTRSREECMESCLDETKFDCRSVNYNHKTGECSLSDMDRHTLPTIHARERYFYNASKDIDYIESNCVREPNKLCDFRRVSGKILKTVDSVYQNVKSIEECKQKCLDAPYRCHSFDFGDPSNNVCRTSHLDSASLTHIGEPYLQIHGASTYELSLCYNVTIVCKAREMIAHIATNKIFNGKIYAKSKPNSCVNDISNSLEFEISMPYHNLECDVKQASHGKFYNDIVIQHHDMIVTTQDLGLNVHCQYDLSNRSISNNVNLEVDGDVDASGSQSVTVSSPEVNMMITSRNGDEVATAQVGDPLSLRFEIADKSSPYEIFVRELVAVDGRDTAEILLIDSLGCPTDIAIMGSMSKVGGSGQIIEAPFDAFKFPTSEIVQFRALVTPCLPICEPVKCNVRTFDGLETETDSYGKRKRRRRRRRSLASIFTSLSRSKKKKRSQPNNYGLLRDDDEKVVVQTIQISDKFGFKRNQRKLDQSNGEINYNQETNFDDSKEFYTEKDFHNGINILWFVLACGFFLISQLILIFTWSCLRK